MKSSVLAGFMLLTSLLGAALGTARAQEARPLIHPMFSDNMVLQRDRPVPVWGWTQPGAKVTVTFRERGYAIEAGPDGKWTLNLPAAKAGGPHWLRVATSSGQEVTCKNVLMGDVWVCSGQSNMEQGIAAANDAEKEIAAASNANLRLYTVPHNIAYEPQWDPRGQWLVCTPENVSKGIWAGFSAVAYYFGKHLQERYDVPIGLVQTAWGGTPAEAWTSAGALNAKLPEFAPALAQAAEVRRKVASGQYNYAKEMTRWVIEKDPGSNTPQGWELTSLDTSGWMTMALPGAWESSGLPDYDGIVWFRRTFELPASAAGKDAVLHLGTIDDGDTTWVNGWHVGDTDRYSVARVYKVPAHALKAGSNVIAVRAWDYAAAGGFGGKPTDMRLEVDGQSIPLAGDWLYRQGADLATMGPRPQNPNPEMPGTPSVLYNGMIAPIQPFAIKGAIWYQGESNASRAMQYRTLLPTMIADWRENWGQGDFPFLIVSLANYMERKPEPAEAWWAELREAQALTVQTTPNTGLAIAIDIGDAADIHPRNKQDVGLRLALAARKIAYGEKDVVHSGPTYREHQVIGREIRVLFDNVDGGLSAKDGTQTGRIPGFAVAGADGKFVWADARIAGTEVRTADGKAEVFGAEAAAVPGKRVEGIAVIVSHPNVRDPLHVRYAWADNPEAGLYNKAGLPAVPFRTDAGMGRHVQPVQVVTVPQPTVPAFSDWREATVTVTFDVLRDGSIAKPRILRSSDIRFNRLALEAAKKVVANPATVNGQPVDSSASWKFSFVAR